MLAAEVNLTYLPIRHGYTLFGSGGRASTLILSQGNVIEYYGKGGAQVQRSKRRHAERVY